MGKEGRKVKRDYTLTEIGRSMEWKVSNGGQIKWKWDYKTPEVINDCHQIDIRI